MSAQSKKNDDGTMESWYIGPYTGPMTDEELRAATSVPESWETIEFKANKWDYTMPEDRGQDSHWQAKGRYKPPADDLRGLIDLLARAEGGGQPLPIARVKTKDQGVCLEIAPMDLHIGMYAWAYHTGARYDLDTATGLFLGAVRELLGRASPFNPTRIAFVFGNDFAHVDTEAMTTTGGTQMKEVSGTFHEIISRCQEAVIEAIEMCRLVCPVDIIVVAGNHDKTGAWLLGQYLKAWYRDCDDVEIDDNPSLTKYYSWGSNLLGFNHGKLPAKEYNQLAAQMASDVPQMWANSKFREWHMGHIHSSTNREIKGVRIRHLPSLVATNNWHHDMNFRSQRRACEAYLWGAETGYLGHLSVNIDPTTGELL